MDWYLERSEQVPALRHALTAYLSRHASDGAEQAVADAELIAAETVNNALIHTGGPVWVSLTWAAATPVLRVYDVGAGFVAEHLEGSPVTMAEPPHPDLDWADDPAESGRGLLILRALAPDALIQARRHAGMLVTVPLAVPRHPATSVDPPRHRGTALPDLEERRPEGGFGKESFLRALVVQLAQAVEDLHGPDAAEAAVAQVGIDVGGQMEQEFRLAQHVVGTMTPEELGRCFVRLKHAIDGDFRVVEADASHVVLENTRCPFGHAVTRAPALCRMTTSVFGGIAASNSAEGAAVVLEERIAVGDPGCRVVVYLGAPPREAEPFTHRYQPPTPDVRDTSPHA